MISCSTQSPEPGTLLLCFTKPVSGLCNETLTRLSFSKTGSLSSPWVTSMILHCSLKLLIMLV